MAEHLLLRPAEDALGGRVPQPNARVRAELHERERRGIDQRLQPLLLLLSFGDVAVDNHMADRAATRRLMTGAAPIITFDGRPFPAPADAPAASERLGRRRALV